MLKTPLLQVSCPNGQVYEKAGVRAYAQILHISKNEKGIICVKFGYRVLDKVKTVRKID